MQRVDVALWLFSAAATLWLASPVLAAHSTSHQNELVSVPLSQQSAEFSSRLTMAARHLVLAQASVGGPLYVRSSVASVCPGGQIFIEGETAHLDGSGFASSAVVDISFGENHGDLALLTSTNADSSGAIDVSVSIPTGVATTPYIAVMQARGSTASGATRRLTSVIPIVTSAGGDGDSDGFPDACDNCPMLPNSGQEDDDGDNQGNICDPCPLDSDNDSDGDGLCLDVDPCPFDPDNDIDGDGRCAGEDNCPNDPNPNQVDRDSNGIGDACQVAPTCSDGVDNDLDGRVDHPNDPGCSDPTDSTETDPGFPCDDGIDNDADGKIDFRSVGGDPGCSANASLPEDPECDDRIDNDGDGNVDWDGDHGLFPADAECGGVGSAASEMPEPSGTVGVLSGLVLIVALYRRRSKNGDPRNA